MEPPAPPTSLPLTPQVCGFLADELEHVIKKLRGWNIRVLDVSRLARHSKVLRQISLDGAYPRDPEKLRLAVRALLDAHEFRYILPCLTDDQVPHFAKQLQLAIGGSVDRDELDRMPYQYQTQFWVGAALAFAGVQPMIPAESGRKSPDYVIENGTIHYGVEVKRPRSAASCEKAVVDAVRQLRSAKVGGAVVVDITDCLSNIDLVVDEDGGGPAPSDLIQAEFMDISARLEALTFNPAQNMPRPSFLPATVLVVVGTILRWDVRNQGHPDIGRLTRFVAVNRSSGPTLEYHRTSWLRDLLFEGFRAVGYDMQTTGSAIQL
jgi:hypothetical protein